MSEDVLAELLNMLNKIMISRGKDEEFMLIRSMELVPDSEPEFKGKRFSVLATILEREVCPSNPSPHYKGTPTFSEFPVLLLIDENQLFELAKNIFYQFGGQEPSSVQ